MTLKGTTHVKACNIEVKFELAEIGAEKGKELPIHYQTPLRGEGDLLGEDNSRTEYIIRKDRPVRSSLDYILIKHWCRLESYLGT